MHQITSPAGITLSYDRCGDGPPLVLVHGAFSDHDTNWAQVKDALASEFTVYAVARRGRGCTAATHDHTVEDEGRDVACLVQAIDEPVFLLGHSYGAHVALLAAAEVPQRVRKLVLYEPPQPDMIDAAGLAALDLLAQAGDWDGFATRFFGVELAVPQEELAQLRATEFWPPIVADAPASHRDVMALSRYSFEADRFRALPMPVLLQIGSESPRQFFVTDALAAVLRDVRIEALAGQAHEGMTTAPQMYVESLSRFLAPAAGR